MTNECLTLLLNGIQKSNPTAVLFKSIEGMSIDSVTCHNLTVINIANEVSIGCQDKDEKMTTLIKKLCFSDKEYAATKSCTKLQLSNGGNAEKKKHYALEATKHIDFKLEKSGLYLDKNRAYIGASPDGIMYCKCHGKAVIEIKCPFSIKDSKIADGYGKCDFLTLEDDSIVLKTSHKYYTQINSQIALSNSTCGYFVVWTSQDILVQNIEFNKNHWEAVSTNLEIFFKSYVAERILRLNPIEFCGSCEKVLFEENEIAENELDLRSICCDQCNCWYIT
ncbi:RNA-directed DNA polymerase from mobile element jockey [Paramuricea clavata]|uniref:RNA-directed DNA polymerase from mobile element jockey n=1 Tax=Paramuricea clavata TaxID=317549 RepID=A0A6S7GLB9_PARCT|nr:RNA-directed DNA polymerase from mobile element jockey [Paramuricea clavata]